MKYSQLFFSKKPCLQSFCFSGAPGVVMLIYVYQRCSINLPVQTSVTISVKGCIQVLESLVYLMP